MVSPPWYISLRSRQSPCLRRVTRAKVRADGGEAELCAAGGSPTMNGQGARRGDVYSARPDV
jgi:hypothetical protein